MKKMEAYYNEIKKLNDRYEADKDNKDIAAGIREEYKEVAGRIDAEGKAFVQVFKMYESMMDRGNLYIDVDDIVNSSQVSGFVKTLREYGFQFFTFSSGWSNSNEIAWEFVNNGCVLCGMTELKGKHKGFMSEEYEKIHGFLFRTM